MIYSLIIFLSIKCRASSHFNLKALFFKGEFSVFYHIVTFLALSTLLYSQKTVDLYSPVGDTHRCVKDVQTLLAESYRHYPSIQASRQMILGAGAQVESAKWNYFPTPSVDFSQRSGRQGMTVRVDQPLWTGGKLDAASDMAIARQDEAQYTLGETSYALAERFLNILQNMIQKYAEIQGFKEGKAQLESFSEMLDKRITAGISSESDRELLNSRIAKINADLKNVEARYEMSRSQLELLIGHPLKCAVGFSNASILKQNTSLSQMKEALVQTHPTLKKYETQIRMAQAEKRDVDAAIMPNISLRAEHLQGSIYTDDPVNDDNLVYVALSFNPGAGLSSLSNMESAKYKLLQRQDELRAKEQELLDVLVADYADYHAAVESMESVKNTISASQKVLESYARLFIAGKRQWLDLVNLSREVTQNKISLASLKALLITSSYRLALQTGNLYFESEED